MRPSNRSRLALKAMLMIAKLPNRCTSVASLEAIGSHSFCEQILQALRRANLVDSAKGPGGGYKLARCASAITVADVVKAIDHDESAAVSRIERPRLKVEKGNEHFIDSSDLWNKFDEVAHSFLQNITLQKILDEKRCTDLEMRL